MGGSTAAHLEAAAPLAELLVDRGHQRFGQIAGHLLGRGADRGGPLHQGSQEVSPLVDQMVLGHGPQPLAFQQRRAALPIPDGAGVGGVGMVLVGQTLAQGAGAGGAIPLA